MENNTKFKKQKERNKKLLNINKHTLKIEKKGIKNQILQK